MNGYLTRKKTAEYVGCSVRKFDLKIRPHVPTYLVGGTPMFRKKEIDAWVASQKVGGLRVVAVSTGYAGVKRMRKTQGQKSPLELKILTKLND